MTKASVEQQKDSILNGVPCAHFRITGLDTIKNEKRVYRITEVLLSKENYLPVYYRSEQQGFIDGTDMFVDTYTEIHFSDYNINQPTFTNPLSFVLPAAFILEKPAEPKSPLAAGVMAPELDLTDRSGNIFRLKSQEGKVVLLNFSSVSCPHSIQSTGLLNKLFATYGNKRFSIVTIHPYDDREAIEAYNRKGNIQYPVYINVGNHNTSKYHVDSYPSFYLIDKTGKIIKGFKGYDPAFDAEINSLIQKYL